jgi:hypothetical protein
MGLVFCGEVIFWFFMVVFWAEAVVLFWRMDIFWIITDILFWDMDIRCEHINILGKYMIFRANT